MNKFRLYISCRSKEYEKQIEYLEEILQKEFDGNYEMDIIEITRTPHLVIQEDDIIATPTLVKYEPLPLRKCIGDVYRKEKIKELLLS